MLWYKTRRQYRMEGSRLFSPRSGAFRPEEAARVRYAVLSRKCAERGAPFFISSIGAQHQLPPTNPNFLS